MEDLFGKALGALEGTGAKALSALESSLNEYPEANPTAVPVVPKPPLELAGQAAFAPSTLSAAEHALSFWESLDLEGKKTQWDEIGLQISQFQETSAQNRKALAEQTKAYRSGTASESEKRKLIPLYQAEIDSLTKRAKYAESGWSSMYQLLYDAPDVVPILSSMLEISERVVESEAEARKCRQELEMARKEAASAKVLQTANRRLEERCLELESAIDRKVEEAVALKLKDANRKHEAFEERESVLLAQLDSTSEALQNLQKVHDKTQSQLFDLMTEAEARKAAKQDELEALMEEVEKAQERAQGLERVNEALSRELERVREGLGEEGPEQSLSDMEGNLRSKERLISKLHQQMQQLEQELTTEKASAAEAIQRFQEEVDGERNVRETLQAELEERPTAPQMDELRKKVRILQALVGTDVDEMWDQSADEDDESARINGILKETNRKLAAELTTARIALGDQANELALANSRISDLEESRKELEALVQKLEDDLVTAQAAVSSDSWKDGTPGMDRLLSASRPETSGSIGEALAEDGSMLGIVTAQRERFRKRVTELETENGRLLDSLGKAQQESAKLTADNVSLYQKIRFLETYNSQKTPDVKVRRVSGPQSGHVAVVGGSGAGRKNSRYACFSMDDPGGFEGLRQAREEEIGGPGTGPGAEMRYRKLYEDRMDPFKEFHQREQEQSYRSLRLHDKITLTSGRFFLSNKYARTFIFFYTLLLHFLIFFVLYNLSVCSRGAVTEVSASQLPEEFVDAIGNADAGGGRTFGDVIAERMGSFMEGAKNLTTAQ